MVLKEEGASCEMMVGKMMGPGNRDRRSRRIIEGIHTKEGSQGGEQAQAQGTSSLVLMPAHGPSKGPAEGGLSWPTKTTIRTGGRLDEITTMAVVAVVDVPVVCVIGLEGKGKRRVD